MRQDDNPPIGLLRGDDRHVVLAAFAQRDFVNTNHAEFIKRIPIYLGTGDSVAPHLGQHHSPSRPSGLHLLPCY